MNWMASPACPACTNNNVALAADDLLGAIEAAQGARRRRLDRLAVDHPGRGMLSASDPLAIEHQRHIMDGFEQEPARQSAEPPIGRLPRRKMDRQHSPAAARPHQIADRVDDLAQVRLALAPAALRPRQQRLDPRPLLVGQIRGIAFRSLRDRGHPATRALGPHTELESHFANTANLFPNGL